MDFVNAILGFVQNQQFALLAALLVPFLYKYIPWFKDFSNGLCAVLAALAAWATNVLGPTPAHASVVSDVAMSIGPIGGIVLGFIDGAITKFVHDHFFNPAYKALGLKKPEGTA